MRVARAAFPKGNDYMTLRDELETIYTDSQFVPLFSQRGQSAESPWRLAVVTILQFAGQAARHVVQREAFDLLGAIAHPHAERLHEVARELRRAPRVPDQPHIYTAGEKEYYNTQRVMAEGVEITPGVQKGLNALRQELNITGHDLVFLGE